MQESPIVLQEYRDTFRRITDYYLARFQYITDKEARGQNEHWSRLQSFNGLYWGDCEDLAITVIEDAHKEGVPERHLILHYVTIPNIGGHGVAECLGWVADCNQSGAVPRMTLRNYDWVSYRRMGDGMVVAS